MKSKSAPTPADANTDKSILENVPEISNTRIDMKENTMIFPRSIRSHMPINVRFAVIILNAGTE